MTASPIPSGKYDSNKLKYTFYFLTHFTDARSVESGSKIQTGRSKGQSEATLANAAPRRTARPAKCCRPQLPLGVTGAAARKLTRVVRPGLRSWLLPEPNKPLHKANSTMSSYLSITVNIYPIVFLIYREITQTAAGMKRDRRSR